ncbi:MAG: TRAFAC clade GTPase domain-containing protein [Thermoplasmataceae archaeon]
MAVLVFLLLFFFIPGIIYWAIERTKRCPICKIPEQMLTAPLFKGKDQQNVIRSPVGVPQPIVNNLNAKPQEISEAVYQEKTKSMVSNLIAESTVGLVGPPTSGKTTFLSFFFGFLQDITTTLGMEASIEQGHEIVQSYFNQILTKGTFPSGTAETFVGQVTIRFSVKGKLKTKNVYLRVNDIGGEMFNKLTGSKENVRRMLQGTPYEYLLTSAAYIFMIDCSRFINWTTDDLTFTRILDSILSARPMKKLKIPIAFVFMKSDTLPEAVFNFSASQLLESLSQTSNFVHTHFSEPASFKIFIKTERNAEGDIVPKIDITAGGRKNILYDPTVNRGFQELAQWICSVGGLN